MSTYNLQQLLSVYKDINSKEIDESNYISWINKYVELSKPDFLVILNVKSLSPIIFQKNYNLKFGKGKAGNVQDIIDGIEEVQKTKIFEADTKVIDFAYDNYVEPIRCTYYLRFNSKISNTGTTALMRHVTVLSRDEEDMPHLVAGCFFDVGHLNGSQDFVQIDIKNYIDGVNVLDTSLLNLKEELEEIFKPQICLTKREKQILELISNGSTSAQIAERLNISIATVNTHRQNLIKKNNVNSTTALLNVI
jgi:DNA-binding CsgD family transcriptional regulator